MGVATTSSLPAGGSGCEGTSIICRLLIECRGRTGAAAESSLQVMMMSMQPIKASLLLAVLLLAACNAYPPYRPGTAAEGNIPGQPGPAAVTDHARAAAQYESAAAAQAGAAQADSLLAATREWLAAGRAADAARVLTRLNGMALAPAQSTERALLNAETALDAQRTQEAWQRIAALPEPGAGPGAQRFFLLKMRIALAAARPVDAILAEMAGERLVTTAERTGLRSQLLAGLRDARDRGVKLEPQSSQDPTVKRLAGAGRDRDLGPWRFADRRRRRGALACALPQSPGAGGIVAGIPEPAADHRARGAGGIAAADYRSGRRAGGHRARWLSGRLQPIAGGQQAGSARSTIPARCRVRMRWRRHVRQAAVSWSDR